MCDIMQMALMVEPHSFCEVMASPDTHLWLVTMQKELKSILDNATWILIPLPNGHCTVNTCWTFKIKHLTNSTIDCLKAHFIAKGYSQIYGINYNNTYTPIIHMEIMHKLLTYTMLHMPTSMMKSTSISLRALSMRSTLNSSAGSEPLWPKTGSSTMEQDHQSTSQVEWLQSHQW
jgi:hypothetical protein